jgi:hypothetical protein
METEMESDQIDLLWSALNPDEQIAFVLRHEYDIRDILVCAGTLDPMVTPSMDDPRYS